MARRNVRTPRPPPSGTGGWWVWGVVLLLAGAVGWLWWQAAYPPERAAAKVERRPERSGRSRIPPSVLEPLPELAETSRTTVPSGPKPEAKTESSSMPELLWRPTNGLTDPRATLPQATAAPPVRVRPREAAGKRPLSRERVMSAQLALNRRGISSGPIDGVVGSQTRAALRTFQRAEGLPVSGDLEAATLERLRFDEPPLSTYTVTAEDLARLTPVPSSWLGKSSRERLDYETILELVSEKAHAHPRLIRQLNPQIDWHAVRPGATVTIPASSLPTVRGKAGLVRISLAEKALRVYDTRSNLLAYFPCSIARRVEKRPVGELHVAVLAPNPNYRFDPDIFSESAEARTVGRRLMIPPGPNNPVGTAWIGLNRPGYGIHGTPHPEAVGRTESHGCFRLANWNAEYLLKLAWVGLPVVVEP